MTPDQTSPIAAESFAAVYDEHAAGVFAAAQRVLRDPAQAEDVTQDVFLAHWRHPSRFDPSRGPLGAYLRVMARSRALDALRSASAARRAQDRLERAAVVEAPAPPDPQSLLRSAQRGEDLRAAVAELPLPQREAVALSFWGDLSTREIAAHHRVPHGTVKSRMRLGLRKLRESVDTEHVAA